MSKEGQKFDLYDVDVTATIELKDMKFLMIWKRVKFMAMCSRLFILGDHYKLCPDNDEEDLLLTVNILWNEIPCLIKSCPLTRLL